MENYIERTGGPLPALRRIIETDVGELLHHDLPHISARPRHEQAGVLQAVTDALDEFFHCIAYTLYQTYHTLPDEPAKRLCLSEYQYTTLQLLGHLLRYTGPKQLHAGTSDGSFKDACCYYVYRALNSLLDSTIQLAGGDVDADLPMPPAARTLLQEMIVGDLTGLRQHLEALHVSPALVNIVLAPFRTLPHDYSVTFYRLHYLRTLKQALLAPPLPGYDVIGDSHVLWTLVAQNYNAPEFIAWFQHVVGAQRGELDRYKMRLTTHPGFSSFAWHPGRPTVREQLRQWLELHVVMPAGGVDLPGVRAQAVEQAPDEAPEEENAGETEAGADDLFFLDAFTLRISPKIVAVIANAARMLHYIFWGKDITHIAKMVARIPTVHHVLSAESLRRGVNELATLRRAREILMSLVHFFDDQIKTLEEKSFR